MGRGRRLRRLSISPIAKSLLTQAKVEKPTTEIPLISTYSTPKKCTCLEIDSKVKRHITSRKKGDEKMTPMQRRK
jgi:hypothetical protein